ncbi:MAG: phenylalanine--tRNA ligase subunit alpha [Anaerolineaceae bacterium]
MTEEVNILEALDQIEQKALDALAKVNNEESLQSWRSAFLGKNAVVMQAFSNLSNVSKEMRPQVGQTANRVKQSLEAALLKRSEEVKAELLKQKIANEKLDITLPGRKKSRGRLHPETRSMREIFAIFAELGFQIYHSNEVETEEYNFELLNIPSYHPARDMWDTLHTTSPGVILRTHTSPGQIRAMREYAPEPIRVILPGMVYRYEQISARSEIQFNQIELLAVGKTITFGDMKGTLNGFVRRFFGSGVRTRLRPSYFPFTEPSAEMDVECFICGGKGCSVCKGSGWLEILGCGMIHPVVLQNGGYDPEIYTGFAAGMGPERIAMLRYHIEDIRYFWGNDVRFLEQF